MTATNAVIGFYLAQVAVLSLGVLVLHLSRGNPWALLLAPITLIAFHFAADTLRRVAVVMSRYR